MKLFAASRQMQTPPHKRDAPKIEQTAGAAAEPGESGQSGRLALLTPREHELFLLLLEGYTLKEAADRLSVKYSTANTHMTGVYKKLNVNSRAELIIRYRGTGKKPTELGGPFHPTAH